jgi:hypothetical protein
MSNSAECEARGSDRVPPPFAAGFAVCPLPPPLARGTAFRVPSPGGGDGMHALPPRRLPILPSRGLSLFFLCREMIQLALARPLSSSGRSRARSLVISRRFVAIARTAAMRRPCPPAYWETSSSCRPKWTHSSIVRQPRFVRRI